jgi:hypothetical protein
VRIGLGVAVSFGMVHGNRRDRRDKNIGRGGSGSVGDAGNVGDLDNVGSAGENGRGNGMDSMCRSAACNSVAILLAALGSAFFGAIDCLGALSLGLYQESPDKVRDDGNGSKTTDDTTGDRSCTWPVTTTTSSAASRGCRVWRAERRRTLRAIERNCKLTALIGRARRTLKLGRGIALDAVGSSWDKSQHWNRR